MVGGYHAGDSAENWEGAADRLDSEAAPDDLLVLQPGWIDTNVDYYTDGVTADTTTVPDNPTPADRERLRQRIAGHDRVWLLRYDSDPAGLTAVLVPTHDRITSESFGAITLVRYERTGTGTPRGD